MRHIKHADADATSKQWMMYTHTYHHRQASLNFLFLVCQQHTHKHCWYLRGSRRLLRTCIWLAGAGILLSQLPRMSPDTQPRGSWLLPVTKLWAGIYGSALAGIESQDATEWSQGHRKHRTTARFNVDSSGLIMVWSWWRWTGMNYSVVARGRQEKISPLRLYFRLIFGLRLGRLGDPSYCLIWKYIPPPHVFRLFLVFEIFRLPSQIHSESSFIL